MPISRTEFEAFFPPLVEDLKKHCQAYGLPENALVWFENVRLLYCPWIRR
jgi:farnesyl diphosphate synthase